MVNNNPVAYKVAVELKKLGFDEPCLYTFGEKELNGDDPVDLSKTDDSSYVRNSELKYGITAPYLSDTLDWIIKRNELFIKQLT